jgi:predicted dehydrogenase
MPVKPKTRAGQDKGTSRRDFLKYVGGVAVFNIVPRYALGGDGNIPPSEKLNIACIGVGDQGTRVMAEYLKMPEVQIVAVCDVNQSGKYPGKQIKGREPARQAVEQFYAEQSPTGAYKGCAAYNDFREMLAKQKDFDAVLVATPDHSHAVVSMAAMQAGKHVHCQKPLTHSVYEARRLAEAAKKYKVATQVFTAIQASESTRQLCEWIWAGAIGPVRQVINWSNRPVWPQGIDRPKDTPPVPEGFDWDLWIGPAPFRPYHPAYHPFNWRGWLDFGTGALGDMGCYSFDTIFRVLKLKAPDTVYASSSGLNTETYPRQSVVTYEFPARGDMPPVTLTWYDGGRRPPRPAELEAGKDMGDGNGGILFVGDNGKILCDFQGSNPRIIPDSKMQAYKQPPQTLPRSIGHDKEWFRACKGGQPGGANFEVSGLITEALLLGNVALRFKEPVKWDSDSLKVTNIPEANKFIQRDYRQGWVL